MNDRTSSEQRANRLVVLCFLWLTSCGAKVVFEQADAGGNTASSGGSNQGAGPSAGGGDGGFPQGAGGSGGQGGEPDPGPICESFAWAGEPVVLPGVFNPTLPQLAALGDGSAGIAYMDNDIRAPIHVDVVLSNVLQGAFDSWPPRVSDTKRHYDGNFENNFGGFSSRRDGQFGLTAGYQALLGSFAEVEIRTFDGFFGVELQRGEMAGAYLAQGTFDHLRFSHLDLRNGDLTPAGELVSGLCAFPTFGDATDKGLLFSMGTNPSCGLGSSTEQLYFTSSEVAPLASFEIPFQPTSRAIIGGPEQTWFAAGTVDRESLVYPIEAGGQSVKDPWSIEAGPGALSPTFARWQNGVVSVRYEEAEGIVISATDGVHAVRSVGAVSSEEIFPQERLAIVAGSSKGDEKDDGELSAESVLVAYRTPSGIAVARADCVPAE